MPSRMVEDMDVDRLSALAEALARLWPGLAKRAVGAPGGTATGHIKIQVAAHGKSDRPCVVWKFLAISG